MIYVHTHVYVCVSLTDRFHIVPSHQSTVYELAKYLLIVNVLPAAVAIASRIISLFIVHSVQLSLYPVLQLHLAYKLAGALLHVCTLFHQFSAVYHHSKAECSLFGVQSCFILFHSTIIIAPVHPFGCTFIDGDHA